MIPVDKSMTAPGFGGVIDMAFPEEEGSGIVGLLGGYSGKEKKLWAYGYSTREILGYFWKSGSSYSSTLLWAYVNVPLNDISKSLLNLFT